MLTKKRVIKIGLETEAGTYLAPTAALLVEDLSGPKPTAPYEKRSGGGLYLGPTVGGVLGERIGTVSFTVELRSSAGVTFTMPKAQFTDIGPGDRNGLMVEEVSAQLNNSSGNDFLKIDKAAGTLASGIDELLKSCGFALTSTIYAPNSTLSTQETVSIDCFEDGRKKSLSGAQGTCTVEMETSKRVLMKFEYTGNWVAPTDAAMPAWDPGNTAVLYARGGTFTIDTNAKLASKFTIALGQQVTPRYDVNAATGVAYFSVTDFEPTFTFDPESELVAAYDYYGKWLAGTEAAIVLAAA